MIELDCSALNSLAIVGIYLGVGVIAENELSISLPFNTLTATAHGDDAPSCATAHGVDTFLSTSWVYCLLLNAVNRMGRQPHGELGIALWLSTA